MIHTSDWWYFVIFLRNYKSFVIFTKKICNFSPLGTCGLIFKGVDPFIQLLMNLGFREKKKTRISQ